MDNILERIIRYCLNNLSKNKGLSLSDVLDKIGHPELIEDKREIKEELLKRNYAKILDMSMGRYAITRITFFGKQFIDQQQKVKTGESSNLETINQAIDISTKYKSIQSQLTLARKYLDSEDPSDYRNSIKEGINAIESTLKIILNEPKISLGEGIKRLNLDKRIHPAFSLGISKIYGFTSDAGGIRHGLKESDLEITYSSAKFLLTLHSSFVTFLLENYELFEKSELK